MFLNNSVDMIVLILKVIKNATALVELTHLHNPHGNTPGLAGPALTWFPAQQRGSDLGREQGCVSLPFLHTVWCMNFSFSWQATLLST